MQPIKLADNHERYTHIPENGQTRMCLDPWSKLFIKINGDVALCCNAPPIGSVTEQSLEEIVDSEKARTYRVGLVSGELPQACKVCPDRKTTTVARLQEVVVDYLDGNIELIDKTESL